MAPRCSSSLHLQGGCGRIDVARRNAASPCHSLRGERERERERERGSISERWWKVKWAIVNELVSPCVAASDSTSRTLKRDLLGLATRVLKSTTSVCLVGLWLL
jgi:hypothetical protein